MFLRGDSIAKSFLLLIGSDTYLKEVKLVSKVPIALESPHLGFPERLSAEIPLVLRS